MLKSHPKQIYKTSKLSSGNKITSFSKHACKAICESKYFNELSKLKYSSDSKKIHVINRKLVIIAKNDLLGIFDEIKKTPFFDIRVSEAEILVFFEAVVDIFTRQPFLELFNDVLKHPNYMHHRMKNGLMNHTWRVAFYSFFMAKTLSQGIKTSRAAIYHDIAIDTSRDNYYSQFIHSEKGAIIAEKCGEPKEIVNAVYEHLMIHALTRFPSSKISKSLIICDTIVSMNEKAPVIGRLILFLIEGGLKRHIENKAFIMQDTYN